MAEVAVSQTIPYLTFTLGQEVFALEISNVHEVLDYTTITHVPRMPEFLRGVINLRGNVVPVIDLRIKLGITDFRKEQDSCIVIVEVTVDNEKLQLGALTDSVQEVIELDPTDIAPPPRLGSRLRTEFMKGMGKQEDRFLIVLDIDKVLSSEDLSLLQETGAAQATGSGE